ncbi:hypothetical protein B0A55_09629, partial [Friedmanniomyces simplex]
MYSIALCALLLARGSYGITVTNSSGTPSASTTYITETTTYINATTSAPTTASTSAANATSSHIWSLWSTEVYPTNCDAYYTAPGASPSALPGWNASQNSAFFSSAYDCLSSIDAYGSASESWERSNVYYWASTYTSLALPAAETETFTSTSYRLTTLCDGIPRAVTGLNASSTLSTYTTAFTYRSSAVQETYTSTISLSTAPYTTPPPTCSLNCAACSMLYAAQDYSLSSYDALSQYTSAASVLAP